MSRTITLISLLTFSVMSALAVRSLLSASDMNGQTLINLGVASLNLEYTVNTGINF